MRDPGGYICAICLESHYDTDTHRCVDVVLRLRRQLQIATEALEATSNQSELRGHIVASIGGGYWGLFVEWAQSVVDRSAKALETIRGMSPPARKLEWREVGRDGR